MNDSGIFVRGFDSKTKQTDLVKYFAQFGNTGRIHFSNDFLILDFKESGAVEKILAKRRHFFHGKCLVVKRKRNRKNNLKVPINDAERTQNLHQSIINSLENNFQQDILALVQKLQPDQSQSFQKHNSICRDLHKSLTRQLGDKVTIHPFGSTLTGLNFAISDIDVYVNVERQETDTDIDVLKSLRKALFKSVSSFGNVFLIANAKIPLVKCVHLATMCRCDLNVKNMLGVRNSELIARVLNVNVNVKRAILVLKYWAKCHKITGQNHLFTNYALVVLYLFFLQENFEFPSVFAMQQGIEPAKIDFWNAAINPNPTFPNLNVDVFDVLFKFFNYYATFDFSSCIISTYLAQRLPKTYFDDPVKLPDSFLGYREYAAANGDVGPLRVDGAMCVQDPFEHNRNICGFISQGVLDQFVGFCQLAVKICSEGQAIVKRLLEEQMPEKFVIKPNYFSVKLGKDTQKVVKFLQKIFEDVLLISATPNGAAAFNCSAKINVWHTRKATAKQLKLSTQNWVEREITITQNLLKKVGDASHSKEVLTFKLTVENVDGEVVVDVYKVAAYKKSFLSFAKFFVANAPLWWKLQLKDDKINNY